MTTRTSGKTSAPTASSPSLTFLTSSRKRTAWSCDAPELSIVVPTYNEAQTLPALFATIAAQCAVRLELILSDGGSCDGTPHLAAVLSADVPFPVHILSGTKGRALQLNRGAVVAQAERLLFLHADSTFPDPHALRKAVDAITAAKKKRGDSPVAGHFQLTFRVTGLTPNHYRYYEKKARLHRRGCTHGDQGLLMSADWFEKLGAFDETLPCMEDTFLAEKIRESGTWILFPSCIGTSARRFESEGFLQRQTLNAILMTLAAVRKIEWIRLMADAYRSQDTTGRLCLAPFFRVINHSISNLSFREKIRFWYRTGGYIRSNAWQVPFYVDHMRGEDTDGGEGPFLRVFDRFVEPVIDNCCVRLAATALAWLWFRVTALALPRGDE